MGITRACYRLLFTSDVVTGLRTYLKIPITIIVLIPLVTYMVRTPIRKIQSSKKKLDVLSGFSSYKNNMVKYSFLCWLSLVREAFTGSTRVLVQIEESELLVLRKIPKTKPTKTKKKNFQIFLSEETRNWFFQGLVKNGILSMSGCLPYL